MIYHNIGQINKGTQVPATEVFYNWRIESTKPLLDGSQNDQSNIVDLEFLSRWETFAKMRQVSLKFPHQDSNQLAMDNKFMKLGYSTSLETCINKRTVTNKLWTTHEKSSRIAPDYTCRTMDEYSSCLTLELVESRTPTNSSTEAFESLKSDWCLRSIAAKGEPNHFWSTFNDCIVWKYKHSIIEILWPCL